MSQLELEGSLRFRLLAELELTRQNLTFGMEPRLVAGLHPRIERVVVESEAGNESLYG